MVTVVDVFYYNSNNNKNRWNSGNITERYQYNMVNNKRHTDHPKWWNISCLRWENMTRVSVHKADGRLTARSREVSNQGDSGLDITSR